MSDFSTPTLETKRSWSVLRLNVSNVQPRLTYPAKFSFKIDRNNAFPWQRTLQGYDHHINTTKNSQGYATKSQRSQQCQNL